MPMIWESVHCYITRRGEGHNKLTFSGHHIRIKVIPPFPEGADKLAVLYLVNGHVRD